MIRGHSNITSTKNWDSQAPSLPSVNITSTCINICMTPENHQQLPPNSTCACTLHHHTSSRLAKRVQMDVSLGDVTVTSIGGAQTLSSLQHSLQGPECHFLQDSQRWVGCECSSQVSLACAGGIFGLTNHCQRHCRVTQADIHLSLNLAWLKFSNDTFDACWYMHVEACWRMLTHVDACWRMLMHFDAFWWISILLQLPHEQ